MKPRTVCHRDENCDDIEDISFPVESPLPQCPSQQHFTYSTYPVCETSIRSHELAEHASLCADKKFSQQSAANCEETKQPQTLQPTTSTSHDAQPNFFGQLKEQRDKFMCENHVKFVVRRSNVFGDVMKKLETFFSADEIRPIKVEFVGEGAVDDGGPLRELFTVFYQSLPGKLVCGRTGNYTFAHDVHSIERNHFYLLGKLMAIGFLQNISGPRFFCKPLVNYILTENESSFDVKVDIADVPLFEIQEKLKKIEEASTDKELTDILDDFPERFECGYNKFAITLNDKTDLIAKVSNHFTLTRCLEAIQQYWKGISSYSILHILRQFKFDVQEGTP